MGNPGMCLCGWRGSQRITKMGCPQHDPLARHGADADLDPRDCLCLRDFSDPFRPRPAVMPGCPVHDDARVRPAPAPESIEAGGCAPPVTVFGPTETAAAPVADLAPSVAASAAAGGVVLRGFLGMVPGGPLWRVRGDGFRILIEGQGLALAIDAGSAAALHHALGAALREGGDD
jgi:hypothetical protein